MNIDLDVLLALSNKKDLPIKKGYTLFLNHISEFKRSETLRYYKNHYNDFISFCECNNLENCNQIKTKTILTYIHACKKSGNKNATINKKVKSVKTMLNYLYKMQLIEKPNLIIESLPNDSTRFNVLSKNQVQQILQFANSLKPKCKLQILLLLYTGIRRNELIHILIKNIKQDYIILEYTKTKKSRNIYITKEISDLIEIVKKDSKMYLFENLQHTDHENPDNINSLFNYMNEKIGLKTSPHCLRHTFATQLLENGADLESIRLLMGHSDYSMLMRYVHIKNKKLAELSTSLYKA